jgi:hypothetical protein
VAAVVYITLAKAVLLVMDMLVEITVVALQLEEEVEQERPVLHKMAVTDYLAASPALQLIMVAGVVQDAAHLLLQEHRVLVEAALDPTQLNILMRCVKVYLTQVAAVVAAVVEIIKVLQVAQV